MSGKLSKQLHDGDYPSFGITTEDWVVGGVMLMVVLVIVVAVWRAAGG
jgi:hypothetical protein